MRTIKTYRKVGAFYIAWEADFLSPFRLYNRHRCNNKFQSRTPSHCLVASQVRPGSNDMATLGVAALSGNLQSQLFEGFSLAEVRVILSAAKQRRYSANSVMTHQGSDCE